MDDVSKLSEDTEDRKLEQQEQKNAGIASFVLLCIACGIMLLPL